MRLWIASAQCNLCNIGNDGAFCSDPAAPLLWNSLSLPNIVDFHIYCCDWDYGTCAHWQIWILRSFCTTTTKNGFTLKSGCLPSIRLVADGFMFVFYSKITKVRTFSTDCLMRRSTFTAGATVFFPSCRWCCSNRKKFILNNNLRIYGRIQPSRLGVVWCN